MSELDPRTARFLLVLEKLADEYPSTPSLLTYDTPFQLLIAVILSAQTTDNQVNNVTPGLFSRYPGIADLAGANQTEVESLIRSTGYYRTKAKNIIAAAKTVNRDFSGSVPGTMEELLTIPGTGRKTAGVILNHLYKVPAIIVDTHFGRVCRRLGFAGATDPVILEREVASLLPKEHWGAASMRLNYHGRRYCMARKPTCDSCPIAELCPRTGVAESKA